MEERVAEGKEKKKERKGQITQSLSVRERMEAFSQMQYTCPGDSYLYFEMINYFFKTYELLKNKAGEFCFCP